MTAISAIFWGLVVISLLVVLHEGGHFLAARAFGVRVTEFFLGMPCKARISRRSRKYGTEFGVTPILLGGYNRICGMEYLGNDRLGDVLALVQRDGTTTASKVADELGMSYDDAYDDLLTLTDWGSIARTKPSSKDEEGEDVFSTLQRDANLLTMYDKGHDFGSIGTTGAGEARPIDDAAAFCETERARTYEGRSWWQRILLLLTQGIDLQDDSVGGHGQVSSLHIPIMNEVINLFQSPHLPHSLSDFEAPLTSHFQIFKMPVRRKIFAQQEIEVRIQFPGSDNG